ncbi:amidase [Terrilactibacillus laevilacticus]|uniref:amidase n=1 Tax=Terrilactibacillus laevilacticus TaxID=1380157 RepID=UPI001FE4F55F|nr:amidase [Terrilactibacillus laevilacticus]
MKKNDKARPLEGVPIAIKDLTNTKGLRTTYGCLFYKDHIPKRDASIVHRLKEAGGIIIGKTNTPEFGHTGTTTNRLFGPSRNPWDLTKATGGSSGGSAAAVAAGLVPLAEGSDGGGLIRIPSSFCGVYGFKPTFGRIPMDNHLDGIFGNHEPFIHYGVIGRHVDDIALMFDVVQGDVVTDPFSLPKMQDFASHLIKLNNRDFRIGWTSDFGIYTLDEEVSNLFFDTLSKLERLGITVEHVNINMKKTLPEYITYFESLWTCGLAAGRGDFAEKYRDQLPETLLTMIERGKQLSAVEFKSLETYRAYLYHMMESHFQTYDILISPTLAVPPFDYDQEGPFHINGKKIKRDSDWVMTQLYNLTGGPAISIPIGFTEKTKLPVGIQAAARRLDDVRLLQFAKLLEDYFQIPTLAQQNHH